MARGKAKLNFEIAQEIRREYRETYTTQKKLAEKYNVSINAIRLIIINVNYRV